MRFAFALALTLAACSSDPAPAADAGPADTGTAVDLGAPVDAGIDVPRDTGTDQGPPIDDPPVVTDTGPAADVGNDTGPTDTGPPIDEPPPDTGPAADVPAQLCAEYDRACTTDSECAVCSPVRGMAWCCGAVAGRRQCVVPSPDGTCMGAPDAGPPPDTGLMCGDGTPLAYCNTDSECGGCRPHTGSVWCCLSDGPGVRAVCELSTRPCADLRADAGR